MIIIGAILCIFFVIYIIKKYNEYQYKKDKEYYLEIKERIKKQKYNSNNNISNEIKYNKNLGNLKYQLIPNYRKKDYVMTYEELKLYRILIEFANKYNYVIFPQVVLYNIVKVNNKRKNTALFNKIKSKSIDFVICNNKNCKIMFCIELDDETHWMEERRKRDYFINELFCEVGIPLIHIDRKKEYNNYEIENIIKRYIEYKD